jgi:hypothetical protein
VTHITFPCACGRTLRVKADHAGKRTRCPGCREPVLIPDPEARTRPRARAPERGIQAERPSSRSGARVRPRREEEEDIPTVQAVEDDDLPEAEPAPRRRRPRRSSGGGWSPSFSMDPAGGAVLGGLAMMLIAVVWFVGGLMVGFIFFYPPVLFVIGLLTLIGGANGQR